MNQDFIFEKLSILNPDMVFNRSFAGDLNFLTNYFNYILDQPDDRDGIIEQWEFLRNDWLLEQRQESPVDKCWIEVS